MDRLYEKIHGHHEHEIVAETLDGTVTATDAAGGYSTQNIPYQDHQQDPQTASIQIPHSEIVFKIDSSELTFLVYNPNFELNRGQRVRLHRFHGFNVTDRHPAHQPLEIHGLQKLDATDAPTMNYRSDKKYYFKGEGT